MPPNLQEIRQQAPLEQQGQPILTDETTLTHLGQHLVSRFILLPILHAY